MEAVLKRDYWKQNKSRRTISHVRTNAWASWVDSDHCHRDHASAYDHNHACARIFCEYDDILALVPAERGAALHHTCVNARSPVYRCFDGNLNLTKKHYKVPTPSSLRDFFDLQLSQRIEHRSLELVHCWHVFPQSSQTAVHSVEEIGRSVYQLLSALRISV